MFHLHVFVILLWGILMSPLTSLLKRVYVFGGEFFNNVPHKSVIYLGTVYYLVGLGVEGGELGLVVQHLLKVGHVPVTVGRVTMEPLGGNQKISIKPKIRFYV